MVTESEWAALQERLENWERWRRLKEHSRKGSPANPDQDVARQDEHRGNAPRAERAAVDNPPPFHQNAYVEITTKYAKMTNRLLLPENIETMLVNAVLDDRCSQDFAIELREALLKQFPAPAAGDCPKCKGFGIVTKDGGAQEGCDLCAGTGSVRLVPGRPRTVSHASAPRS